MVQKKITKSVSESIGTVTAQVQTITQDSQPEQREHHHGNHNGTGRSVDDDENHDNDNKKRNLQHGDDDSSRRVPSWRLMPRLQWSPQPLPRPTTHGTSITPPSSSTDNHDDIWHDNDMSYDTIISNSINTPSSPTAGVSLKGGNQEATPIIVDARNDDIETNSLPLTTIEAYAVNPSPVVAAAIPIDEEDIIKRKRRILGASILLFILATISSGTIIYFTTFHNKTTSSQDTSCPESLCYPDLSNPSFDPQKDLCSCSCYETDTDIEYYQHCTQTSQSSSPNIYMNIIPIEDSYVRNGTYSTNNYGNDTVIEVKYDVPNRFRYGILRFEIDNEVKLSSITASLFLHIESTGELPLRTVTIKRLVPNNWAESNVTFDNFSPTIDKVGSSIEIFPGQKGQYIKFDITDLMMNGELFLLIEATSDSHELRSYVKFHSRESFAAYSPYIELSSDGMDEETMPNKSCPDRYNGKLPVNECQQHYYCVDGIPSGPLYTCLEEGTLFNWHTQECNLISNVICDDINPTVPTSPPTRAMPDITEFSEYSLVYKLNIPEFGTFMDERISYDIDNTNDLSLNQTKFDRVAYFMELEGETFGYQYIWVSFDAHTNNTKYLGVPEYGIGIQFQQELSNMNVDSTIPSLNGENLKGNIEFWPFDSRPNNALNISGASDEVNDWGDVPKTYGRVGSMQVHSYELQSVLFAVNKWNDHRRRLDIGIGNCPPTLKNHPDWTGTSNANFYITRELSIFIRIR